MIRIPLGAGAYRRQYGDMPEVKMENRFFESNPTTEEGSSLLSRPGSGNFIWTSGDAPFRALFTKNGVFTSSLFYVDADDIYRLELGDIPRVIVGSHPSGFNDISFAVATGLYYEHLFVTYDGFLQYYAGEGYAKAFVAYDPANPPLDQEVRIGTVHYKFRGVGTVDTGTPAGTSANPYLLDIDDSLPSVYEEWKYALGVLAKAINASGTPGEDYSSTLTTPHGAVHAVYTESFGQYVALTSKTRGSAGNAEEVESVSGSIPIGNASGSVTTGAVNFEGGGVEELVDVATPDNVEISKVVAVGGFVLAIEKDSNRFFYIRPGSVEIGALDYESAEAEPDVIVDAVTSGDFVYLFGRSSVETWYVAGDAERPIQRIAGGSHRIGAIPGTAAIVQQYPVFVGSDNLVYALGGGAPQRISDHGIEERLRLNGVLPCFAWSFALDGHFFYVLTIENQGTFVYDATTQQWHRWWTAGREPYWNGVRGVQWGSYILGLDWSGDNIWQINPLEFTDEGAEDITRVVTGFLPLRERRHARNSLVRVFASLGNHEQQIPPTVLSLRFSDDNGQTWAGPYEVSLSELALQQIDFRSLGTVGFPGRIYEFSDTAGLLRIDAAYAQLD